MLFHAACTVLDSAACHHCWMMNCAWQHACPCHACPAQWYLRVLIEGKCHAIIQAWYNPLTRQCMPKQIWNKNATFSPSHDYACCDTATHAVAMHVSCRMFNEDNCSQSTSLQIAGVVMQCVLWLASLWASRHSIFITQDMDVARLISV